jgi:hypothetical protein
MTRPLSAKAARAVTAAAEIVKAPDHRDTNTWHVVAADGTVLVVIEPSYGGTSRTGRNGWNWWLADGGRTRNPVETTIQKAAIAGLLAWEQRATRKPRT